ncbi:hypothetical protein AVEN_272135-1 [Araneus ventricosus]|uniref:Uncharacterized protein n=1 Tax=Araneus ventricosus TaxID=182803 RepID=A0A4Y2VSP4_ARAVE|nr:hypothetical protein AVEN_272135-1 [Araneus ventricosus]
MENGNVTTEKSLGGTPNYFHQAERSNMEKNGNVQPEGRWVELLQNTFTSKGTEWKMGMLQPKKSLGNTQRNNTFPQKGRMEEGKWGVMYNRESQLVELLKHYRKRHGNWKNGNVTTESRWVELLKILTTIERDNMEKMNVTNEGSLGGTSQILMPI